MGFDPTKYKVKEPKKLPVVLLLDVSGSMAGEKIASLQQSVDEMLDCFVREKRKETRIEVAIITFGRAVQLHTPYTEAEELQSRGVEPFRADGMTPLGTALRMAKDMLEDRTVTSGKMYTPAVLLVSDGAPNDMGWERELQRFISEGRSAKCQRFALAIGQDADRKMLKKFSDPEVEVMVAEDASRIADSFRKFTMSVSSRTSVPAATGVSDPAIPCAHVEPKQEEEERWF